MNSRAAIVKNHGTGQVLLQGLRNNLGLYKVNAKKVKEGTGFCDRGHAKSEMIFHTEGEEVLVDRNNTCDSRKLWYYRLGHPNDRILNQIIRDYNLKVNKKIELMFCESCKYGKSHSLPFKASTSKTSRPL